MFKQWLKLATSNLVHSLGLLRLIIKSYPEEKVGVALDYGKLSDILGFPIIFLQRLELMISNLDPSIKPLPEEKWAWPWAREAPKYLGFPFSIFATAALSS